MWNEQAFYRGEADGENWDQCVNLKTAIESPRNTQTTRKERRE